MDRKHRWLLVQALVSAVLLALLLLRLDLAAFVDLFLGLPVWFYVASLLTILAGQVLYAWRWRLLLRAAGADVQFPEVLRQYFIGIFVNNFLPSTVGGDLAKVYYLGRDHGYRRVTASVVVDRLLGVGVLALLAAVAMGLEPAPSMSIAAARVAVTGVAGGIIVISVIALVGTGGLPGRVKTLGKGAVAVAKRLQRLRMDMAAALRQPSILLQAFLVVGVYFLGLAAIYAYFIELQTGRFPSFQMTFAIVAATSVLVNVPISLNGVGLREQLHAALLASLGVSSEAAVGIALLLFGHMLIASLIGLVFWVHAPPLPKELPASDDA